MPPRLAASLALLACACSSPSPTATRDSDGAANPDESGPRSVEPVEPLGPQPFDVIDGSDVGRTADGIPIVVANPVAARREGDVVWVRPALQATDSLPRHESSDGETIYLVIDEDASVLVRGGVVHEDVMKRFGIERGGCGAARGGALILSGEAPTGEDHTVVSVDGRTGRRTEAEEPTMGQLVVRIDAQGQETRLWVPPALGHEQDCRAWLAADGRFALGLFGIVEHDGQGFAANQAGLDWYTGRTVMGEVGGPRYCFWSCNATEAQQTHPDTARLLGALDRRSGPTPEWVALDGWIAGASRDRAVRMKLGGAIESVAIPESSMLSGAVDLAFTSAGDLVIGLDYRFHRYVVWADGATALSPIRELAQGEVLAHASPTALIRGLSSPLVESSTFAVVLGDNIGVGTGGSTVDFRELSRSRRAHELRMKRAKAVLGRGAFVGAHEAVVDIKCGAYVRSPVGWEDMVIHDWSPPELPPLSPAAVFKPSTCLPLDQVSALPGNPDVLLAISGGDLHLARLPPPLPIAPERGAPTPPATPQPGSGWTRVGPATAVHGDDGIADPGGDTRIAAGTWQAGGAAVVEVDGETVLVTDNGAVTLPPNTRPMAVGQTGVVHVFGAIGDALVECRAVCRILEPGPSGTIVAVVPRSETEVALGYEDGRIGSYALPDSGGREHPQHALVAEINRALRP